ncbi:MAG: hypothetical protein AAF560_26535 [Acidobacteriota bacterium]
MKRTSALVLAIGLCTAGPSWTQDRCLGVTELTLESDDEIQLNPALLDSGCINGADLSTSVLQTCGISCDSLDVSIAPQSPDGCLMIQDGADTASICPFPNDTTGVFKAVDGEENEPGELTGGINLAFAGLNSNGERQRYSEIKTTITGNDPNPAAENALSSQMRFIVADLERAEPMDGGEDGGVRVFQISGGEFTVNDSMMDIDFRIKSVTSNPAFFVEGATANVGIGTETPDEELDIEGDGPGLRFTNTGPAGGGWRMIMNGNTGRLVLSDDLTGARNPIKVGMGAVDNLLRVGIDTLGAMATDTVSIGSTTTGDANLQVQGSALIDSSVGIGTISPAAELHVQTTGTDHADLYLEAGGQIWDLRSNGVNSVFTIKNITSNTNPFKVQPDAPSNALVVDAHGIGINTAHPSGALDVFGAIYQRGAQLHADYVFEPDYELESIADHAAFMWANKHLPAVPPRRVDENGLEVLEVGAHRQGMLEELETAHIYIEQLHRELEALKQTVRDLAAQVAQQDGE